MLDIDNVSSPPGQNPDFPIPNDFDLPPGWRWATLSSICDGVYDCPHSTPELTATGPLVVRTQDILSGVLDVQGAAHVSEETYQNRIQRAEPRFGDLLYSREGTYFGIAADVPRGTKVCLGQRMVLIRPSQAVNHSYIRIWLNSPLMQSFVAGFKDGTVAERLNLPVIRKLPIALPSLAIQEGIVAAIASLDDKIALNRVTNQTLEQIAQALFQSWFVDFDPVHAKREGRKPDGMDGEMAALFPDGFTETGRGMLPRGWSTFSLESLGRLTTGNLNPLEYPDEEFDHFSLPAFDQTRCPSVDVGSSIKSNKTIVPKDAVLLSKLNPETSRVWFVPTAGSRRQICSTEFLAFTPAANVGRATLFGLFTSFSFREKLLSMVTGTSNSHQRISPRSLLKEPVVVGDRTAFELYERTIAPSLNEVARRLLESQNLESLRDSILPRLLSGELVPREISIQRDQTP